MSQKENLMQLFYTTYNFDKIVKFHGLPDCLVELADKDEYCVGESIQGKLIIKYKKIPYYFSGILLAVDGKITANVVIKGRKWIDSTCNLHLFTYVLRSKIPNRYIVTPTDNTTYMHPFSIKLPMTNLPGSFSSEHGSIIYRVQAVLACNDSYKCIGEKIFTLHPYLNISKLKSVEQLSKQTWQSKDGIFVKDQYKFDKVKNSSSDGRDGASGAVLIKSEDVASSLLSTKRVARFELSLDLPNGFAYVIGEEIPFKIKLENPNGDAITKISLILAVRIICTALKSYIAVKELCRIDNCPTTRSSTIDWIDVIQIPSSTKIISSTADSGLANLPIIFQYLLQVNVERKDKEVLIAETLIGVGTTRNKPSYKPSQAIIDLELCKYPIGYTELSYPEDFQDMIKTGRFGYFENPNMEIGTDFGVKKLNGGICHAMSVVSLASQKREQKVHGAETSSSSSSRKSSSCTLSGSKLLLPPSYSGLSSRRSSCSTLPPTYHNVAVVPKNV